MRRLVWILPLAVGLAGVLSGCDRPNVYSQETPETTLEAAVSMVREGEAARLTELIYADSDRMRLTLDRAGVLFRNLEGLAEAVSDGIDVDGDRVRESATAGLADGSFFDMMQFQMSEEDRTGMSEFVGRFLANPYDFLDESAGRLSTMLVTDDSAVVLLDDKPIFPPVGLSMRRVDGRWYIALPTHMAARFMPVTDDQWQIIDSVIAVFDRTVVETTGEVRSGRVRSLESLGDRAADKLLMPGALAVAAYAREIEVREETGKRMRPFERRLRAWAKQRKADEREVPKSAIEAARRCGATELADAARFRDDRVGFEALDDASFTAMLNGWFERYGLALDAAAKMSGERVDPIVDAWNESTSDGLEAPPRYRSRRDEPLRYLPGRG